MTSRKILSGAVPSPPTRRMPALPSTMSSDPGWATPSVTAERSAATSRTSASTATFPSSLPTCLLRRSGHSATSARRMLAVCRERVPGQRLRNYPVIERGAGPYACPCCRYLTLDERGGFDICQVCFWEDDGQDDPDADVVLGGPNGGLSLTEARANFKAMGACEARLLSCVRPPAPDEIGAAPSADQPMAD